MSDSFIYVANDGVKDSSAKTVAINLTPVNDPPVILGQNDNPVTTPENTAIDVISCLQVSDPDNTYPNDFTVMVQPGANYTVVDGIISPAPDYSGSLALSLMVNDGDANSDLFTLMVMVMAVNDAPIFVSTPVMYGRFNRIYLYSVVVTDPDTSDRMTISAPTLPSWLTLIPSGNGTAILIGRPGLGNLGTHPVVLLVSDNGTPSRFATRSFEVKVNKRDRPRFLRFETESEAQ